MQNKETQDKQDSIEKSLGSNRSRFCCLLESMGVSVSKQIEIILSEEESLNSKKE